LGARKYVRRWEQPNAYETPDERANREHRAKEFQEACRERDQREKLSSADLYKKMTACWALTKQRPGVEIELWKERDEIEAIYDASCAELVRGEVVVRAREEAAQRESDARSDRISGFFKAIFGSIGIIVGLWALSVASVHGLLVVAVILLFVMASRR
jgi:hypothetical protein